MSDSYYHRNHLAEFGSISQGNAELGGKFFDYYGAAFGDGALSVHDKRLIALSVAHVVQCPYCIDAYTKAGLEMGADLEQLTEAVHVGAVVRAEATLTHGVQMLGQASRLEMGSSTLAAQTAAYYDRSHLEALSELSKGSPDLKKRYDDYEQAVFQDSALGAKEKRIIAVADAHALQNPYGIERHTRAALDLGATLEELTEGLHVAVAIRGGASLVHGMQMLEQVKKLTL